MNQALEVLKGTLGVKIGSVACHLHKESHPNCRGCSSYKPCKEYINRVQQYTAQVLIARGDLPRDYNPDGR